MTHPMKLTVFACLLAAAACGTPVEENGPGGTATSATSATASTTGQGTSAGPASSSTSAGPASSTTGEGAATTTAGNGTGTTQAGTTGGACACNTDSDCNDVNHEGFVCIDGTCQMGDDAVGTTGGGCANSGISSSTTGAGPGGTTGAGPGGTTGEGNATVTSGSTGTGCSESCTTVDDCPADPNATSITCGADGRCYYVDTLPSTGGSGGVLCATTGGIGTTGGTGTTGACVCNTDADCNDANHEGFVCENGYCELNVGGEDSAVGTTGGGCANPSSSSTGGTTGGDTNGGGDNGGGNGGSIGTPLVLDFDGAKVSFTRAPGHFELGQGPSRDTDWVSAATPWLALDVNGNGRIDSGAELFGSLTRLPDGARAVNGFAALAALDANHDGVIDARDPAFAKLRIWRDANQDRRSQPGELTSLSKAGVDAIELGYATSARCDDRGNCEREHARFRFHDTSGRSHTGSVIDVYLSFRSPVRVSMR